MWLGTWLFGGSEIVFRSHHAGALAAAGTTDRQRLDLDGDLPARDSGVWLGWRLHGRLDQRQLYRVVYALLVVALKLLWDGVSGYLA